MSAERICDHFNSYICEHYADRLHVRRVATWLGLVIKGVERIKSEWWLSHSRQLVFTTKDGRRYKLRYSHSVGARGGIQIVQIRAALGSPEVATIVEIANLNEAEEFYHNPFLHYRKVAA
jgi:hypothetical protein